MPALASDLRKTLEATVVKARDKAEGGARDALTALAVDSREPFASMSEEARAAYQSMSAEERATYMKETMGVPEMIGADGKPIKVGGSGSSRRGGGGDAGGLPAAELEKLSPEERAKYETMSAAQRAAFAGMTEEQRKAFASMSEEEKSKMMESSARMRRLATIEETFGQRVFTFNEIARVFRSTATSINFWSLRTASTSMRCSSEASPPPRGFAFNRSMSVRPPAFRSVPGTRSRTMGSKRDDDFDNLATRSGGNSSPPPPNAPARPNCDASPRICVRSADGPDETKTVVEAT
jgi:hypothetical protein